MKCSKKSATSATSATMLNIIAKKTISESSKTNGNFGNCKKDYVKQSRPSATSATHRQPIGNPYFPCLYTLFTSKLPKLPINSKKHRNKQVKYIYIGENRQHRQPYIRKMLSTCDYAGCRWLPIIMKTHLPAKTQGKNDKYTNNLLATAPVGHRVGKHYTKKG
jgi:hypothetical protein